MRTSSKQANKLSNHLFNQEIQNDFVSPVINADLQSSEAMRAIEVENFSNNRLVNTGTVNSQNIDNADFMLSSNDLQSRSGAVANSDFRNLVKTRCQVNEEFSRGRDLSPSRISNQISFKNFRHGEDINDLYVQHDIQKNFLLADLRNAHGDNFSNINARRDLSPGRVSFRHVDDDGWRLAKCHNDQDDDTEIKQTTEWITQRISPVQNLIISDSANAMKGNLASFRVDIIDHFDDYNF